MERQGIGKGSPLVGDYQRIVARHRDELARRPALEALYRHWAGRIRRRLSDVSGHSVELGCGSGALSAHLPMLLETDTYAHPWVDEVVDAGAMPWGPGECVNLVAIDVLHHLPEPARFFAECERVLAPGGRCILLEPYISPGSYPLYRFLHHEPMDMAVDPFRPVHLVEPESGTPYNEAIPTLCFKKHQDVMNARWPLLRLAEIQYSDLFVYLLTGGYSRPSILPAGWVAFLVQREDALLQWLGRWLALRILVVLERTP